MNPHPVMCKLPKLAPLAALVLSHSKTSPFPLKPSHGVDLFWVEAIPVDLDSQFAKIWTAYIGQDKPLPKLERKVLPELEYAKYVNCWPLNIYVEYDLGNIIETIH